MQAKRCKLSSHVYSFFFFLLQSIVQADNDRGMAETRDSARESKEEEEEDLRGLYRCAGCHLAARLTQTGKPINHPVKRERSQGGASRISQ